MEQSVEDDLAGARLIARWSSLSEAEKDAALKAMNADLAKKYPYIPTPSKPIDWNETLIAIAFVMALSLAIFSSALRVWAVFACVCCLAWRLGNLDDRLKKLESQSKRKQD